MKFTKMNGLGNDYIFIDTEKETILNPNQTAIRLSDRHRGIGGDGMVLLGRGKRADFSMRIFNADGSEGEMCGNALRCIGKYVYEKGLTEKTSITVETLAGIKSLELILNNGMVECVSANIGKAEEGHKDGQGFMRRIEAAGKIYQVYCVSVGNPHCVIYLGRFNDNIMQIGREISENTAYFPERTNVEFVLIDSTYDILTMRVYERGTGETLACGTGAAACFYASNKLKIVGDRAVVRLPGGDLSCYLNEKGEIITVGTAELNFEGNI